VLALLTIVFCLASAGVLRRTRGAGEPLEWRERLVLGMLATGVWAAAGTELLSIGHWLSFGAVLAWWAVPTLVLVVIASRGAKLEYRQRFARPPCTRGTAALLGLAASIILVTGVVAVICPTNTWDCWQYHLPRVFHWIQQGSVEHFPASDRRQLEMPPFAEFMSMHWALLSGGWAWTNMHQWFALIGAAIAASLGARELGAAGRGQALAALLTVTNPAAAVQATSGKNDVVVAFWALALAWIAARMWRERRFGLEWRVAAGAALGLLLLTKGTGFIIAAPLCAAIAWAMLRTLGWRAVPMGSTIVLIALALNAGHWSRNAAAFGSPLGLPESRGGYPLAARAFTPGILVSGVVRNLSLHTATPWPAVNERERGAVETLHAWLGVSPNDPRTTMNPVRQPFRVLDTLESDGYNPAPVHLALALVLLAFAAARPRAIRDGPGWAALAVPFAGFLLFCTLLRWQPWHLRLQIPFVLLFAPVLGAVLPRLDGAAWRALKAVAIAGAFALAWNDVLWTQARPLLGEASILRESRRERLFQQAPDMRAPLEGAAAAAAGAHPHVIGLLLRDPLGQSYEWPALLLTSRAAGERTPIVNLNPSFGPEPRPDEPRPDVALVANPYRGPVEQRRAGMTFLRRAGFPPFFVYVSGERVLAAMGHADVPAFSGFEVREGLRPEEGPYPNLPFRVRWATPPRTVVRFQSDGSPTLLLIEWRRNERSDQAATIGLNGVLVARYEFGPSRQFWPVRQPLRPRAGENRLEIEYSPEPGGSTARGSVLFKRLQVVPEAGR
jgi:hypothetical protein